MLTIKCYGQGCWIHLLESSKDSVDIYNTIASKIKLPITEALLDVQFYQILKSDIQTIDDLIIDSFGGLLPLHPASLEIWLGRKKIAKISFQELIQPSTLFPLYNVKKINFSKHQFEKGIYLKETVVGCIGVYKIACDNFDIEQLSFTLLSSFFSNNPLLLNFQNKDVILRKVKDDCLTRHQEIIILFSLN
jgi:hypothetical protein